MDQAKASSTCDIDEPDRLERTPSSGLFEPLITAPSSPSKSRIVTASYSLPGSRPVSTMISQPGSRAGSVRNPTRDSPPSLMQSRTSLHQHDISLTQSHVSINIPPKHSAAETTFVNPTAPTYDGEDIEEDERQLLISPEQSQVIKSPQTGYCVYRGLYEQHEPTRLPLQHQPMSYVSATGKPEPVVVAGSQVTCGRLCGSAMRIISWILIVVTFPFSLCACIKLVQEYERAVIFRLGRIMPGGAKGPGMFFILPCIDQYIKIDLRTMSFDVPPQEILTRDSVTVAVDAVVYYRVFNATVSVTNVADADRSTRLLAQTTLRNVLGTKHLSDILVEREEISQRMQETLDSATDPWGIKVERVDIKDVRLPIQLQRAMATEAEAFRDAKAKVIAAEGEHKASKALRDAANVINESPSALQLRYLQTLGNIAADRNSTIVFPIPIDTISSFMQNRNLNPHHHSPAPVHYNQSELHPRPSNQSDLPHHTGGQSHPPAHNSGQSHPPPHIGGQSDVVDTLQQVATHIQPLKSATSSAYCQHCGSHSTAQAS